jgi:putative sugar O-methyltransferase
VNRLQKEFLDKIYYNFTHNSKRYNESYKSEHWKYQNKRKLDLFKIDNLENFRNNGLSTGLDDQFYNKQKTENLLNSLILDLTEKYVYNLLEDKNIGNVKDFLSFKDKYYSANELFHIKYTSLLEKFFEIKESKVICEIGPGYGSFINKLFKRKPFKAILIDLPEANFINAYFLKNMFPNKKFFFSTDIKNEITQDIFKDYDILILCPWDNIDNLKIDLFINTRSMMEMNNETISFYFKKIHKQINLKGIFFCINRYYKDTVGYPIELSEYPYDNRWKVMFSERSWKQDHIHCLITQRIKDEIEDIKNEKKKISFLSEEVRKKDQWIVRRILPNNVYKIYKKIKFFLNKIFFKR